MKIRTSAAASLLAAAASLTAGCNLVKVGVITVAAAVGLAGYAVYKTGDAAVTGAGKAGEAVASGAKSVAKTVVYADGELKVEYPYDVRTVWLVSGLVLRESGFSDIKGTFDALSGVQSAKTREDVDLSLKMRLLPSKLTELRIRVGVKGDLGVAEHIDGLIQRKLPVPPPAGPAAGPAQEVKR